jgi:hypothetical protein
MAQSVGYKLWRSSHELLKNLQHLDGVFTLNFDCISFGRHCVRGVANLGGRKDKAKQKKFRSILRAAAVLMTRRTRPTRYNTTL